MTSTTTTTSPAAAAPSPAPPAPVPPSRGRVAASLAVFLVLTLPLMPVQWLLLRLSTPLARRLPHLYHRLVCRILRVHIRQTGRIVRDRPVLVVANHVSWLDIPVLSAVAPVSFVAKIEVASWPLAGTLARLQRSVFVDRNRRGTVGDTAGEIAGRLATGDAIVLFAEGTSSDGNRVLPFRSSLFAAVRAGDRPAGETPEPELAGPAAVVQTVSIAYRRRCGLPLTWAERRALGYIGDVSLAESVLETLGRGPLEVAVHIGPARPLPAQPDRKQLARDTEVDVRAGLVRLLRSNTGADDSPTVAQTVTEAGAKTKDV